MILLLSNDDGIDAPGLAALEEAVRPLGTVFVVAPETEQSAMSHALTMHKPLRVRERGSGRWAVSGTPADCVYLALHHLLPTRPTLVLSGINRGANLGNDVFYSGTVAAAMEACLQGCPSVALSLFTRGEQAQLHWETAGEVAARIVGSLDGHRLPADVLLNVNVPNLPPSQLRGVHATTLGRRRYEPLVDHRTDPRGRQYFWIGGAHEAFAPIEGSEGPCAEEGWATVTPLRPDLTDRSTLASLRTWTDA